MIKFTEFAHLPLEVGLKVVYSASLQDGQRKIHNMKEASTPSNLRIKPKVKKSVNDSESNNKTDNNNSTSPSPGPSSSFSRRTPENASRIENKFYDCKVTNTNSKEGHISIEWENQAHEVEESLYKDLGIVFGGMSCTV